MRILITGGAGYIGTHTAINLLENGNDLEIIDSFYNSYPAAIKRLNYLKNILKINSKFNFHNGDLRDQKFLEKIFFDSKKSNNPIEAVIHLAGLKSVGDSIRFPKKYWDFNVNGSINLFKVMEKYECRNIVFSSSATIYKYQGKEVMLDENAVIEPTNPYGQTKAEIERILQDINKENFKKWRISILRYFNPIGAHSSGLIGEDPFGEPSNLFPAIIKVSTNQTRELKIFGHDWPTNDGTAIRDYIHVMDLAKAHYLALLKLMEFDSKLLILNIGTGIGTSVLNLVNTFKSINKCDIPYSFTERRKGDFPFVVADNKMAEKILNWKPIKTIEEMCVDGWNWIKKNPNGYQK